MTLRIDLAEARKRNEELVQSSDELVHERDFLNTSLKASELMRENLEEEVEKSSVQVKKVREYNDELNEKISAYRTTVSLLHNNEKVLDAKVKKAKLLLDMARGREKQSNRDTGTMRQVYNDLFEDMMNRQVGMAVAGWDKYYDRKKKAREEADD